MAGCIFCSLQKSEDDIIYKDDWCYVVPDRYPISRGHILVIAVDHYSDMLSTPEDVIGHMFIIAKRYAKINVAVNEATGVNIGTNVGKSAGQAIMHFHIHVIPRYDGQERIFDFGKNKELLPEEMKDMARILKGAAAKSQ